MKISQKQRDGMWTDESGTQIPVNRLTKAEKIMERNAYKLLQGAQKLNADLVAYKKQLIDLSNEAYEAFMAEKEAKTTKGNFTWYNFNRSIKIEVAISDRIEFDDLTIEAAKARFDEFLKANITSKNEFVKDMILDAFQTERKGKLDVKRVLQLTRYEDRINDSLFSEAVQLINEAIRRPSSKTYFRIWLKDEGGKYQNIDLNLSSIEA